MLDGADEVSGGTAEFVKLPESELQKTLDEVEAETAAQQ